MKTEIIGKCTSFKEEDGKYILTMKYKPYGKLKVKKFNRGYIEGRTLYLFKE